MKLFITAIMALFLTACKDEPVSPKPIVSKGWVYVAEKDKFTNELFEYVSIESENKGIVSLSNLKGVNAYLHVNKKHKHLLIRFNGFAQPYMYSGFGCRTNLCHVLVKFDDKPIQKFNLHEPNTGSGSNGFALVLAENGAQKFIENAFKSKNIEIRMHFYDVGKVDFNFVSDQPFSWPLK